MTDSSASVAPPRARDLGLEFPGQPGAFSALTDVPGVRVANRDALSMQDAALASAAYINDAHFDGLYEAAVQSTEEAIINAMVATEDTPTIKSPAGRICRALPQGELIEVMRRYGRCQ